MVCVAVNMPKVKEKIKVDPKTEGTQSKQFKTETNLIT